MRVPVGHVEATLGVGGDAARIAEGGLVARPIDHRAAARASDRGGEAVESRLALAVDAGVARGADRAVIARSGVDLVDARGGDLSGPRTVGARGYAYGSPTGSVEFIGASLARYEVFALTSSTEAQKKSIQFDPDLLALSSSATEAYVIRLDIAQSYLTS